MCIFLGGGDFFISQVSSDYREPGLMRVHISEASLYCLLLKRHKWFILTAERKRNEIFFFFHWYETSQY
jgi:hypothetical protein